MVAYMFSDGPLPGDERTPWPKIEVFRRAPTPAEELSDEELLDDFHEPPHHKPAPEVD